MRFGRGLKIYIATALLVLGWYSASELRGWARAGEKAPALSAKQLRQRDLGYRNHVFWYHGFRGK